ncbi:MAG: hypothetical protein E1N59_195 [Puniceicoccaceae bacterium 5H]|nr:MAG: hypothetical protein E1N59_195 [Puniceicoccaceae bacterium 5H]
MKYQKIIALTTTMLLAGGLFAETDYDEARQQGSTTPVYHTDQHHDQAQSSDSTTERKIGQARIGAEIYGPDGRMLGRVTDVEHADDKVVAYQVTAISADDKSGESTRVSAKDLRFSTDNTVATASKKVRGTLAGLPTNQENARHKAEEKQMRHDATASTSTETEQDKSIHRRPPVGDMSISADMSMGTDRPLSSEETADPVTSDESQQVAQDMDQESTALMQRLHEDLKGSPEVQEDLQQVRIQREGDALVLDGRVSSDQSKDSIEQAVKKATAMNVRNKLEVKQ